MSFIKEFYSFIRARKKYWLLPVILASVLLGVLIVFAEGSAVAPFIYSVF